MMCQQTGGPLRPHRAEDVAAEPPAASPDPGSLADADLERIVGGKEFGRGEMEGSNGWYVRLPTKLRR